MNPFASVLQVSTASQVWAQLHASVKHYPCPKCAAVASVICQRRPNTSGAPSGRNCLPMLCIKVAKPFSHVSSWLVSWKSRLPWFQDHWITGSLVKPNQFGIQIFTRSKLRSHTNYIKHGGDVAWHDGPDRNALRIFSPPESRSSEQSFCESHATILTNMFQRSTARQDCHTLLQ